MTENEWALVHLPARQREAANPSDGAADDLPRLLAAAALGFLVEAQRRSLERTVAVAIGLARPLGVVARPVMAIALRSAAGARHRVDLDGWAARGLEEQRRGLEAIGRAVRAVVAATAAAVLDEVDVDAVVARIDLAALAEQVIAEVDLGGLIRESSSTMASETVDALRVQSMRVDGLLNRIVDRMLLRQGQRQTGLLPDLSPP